MKTEAQYQYDERRKKETRNKLMKTVSDLSKLAKHKTKPITKNEVSRVSGVTRQTIDRFPDVIEKINKFNSKINAETNYTIPLEINLGEIKDLDYAKMMLQSLATEYEDVLQRLEMAKRCITQRDSTIAKLQSEVSELKGYLSSKGRNVDKF